jgi:hypothetical protein
VDGEFEGDPARFADALADPLREDEVVAIARGQIGLPERSSSRLRPKFR